MNTISVLDVWFVAVYSFSPFQHILLTRRILCGPTQTITTTPSTEIDSSARAGCDLLFLILFILSSHHGKFYINMLKIHVIFRYDYPVTITTHIHTHGKDLYTQKYRIAQALTTFLPID